MASDPSTPEKPLSEEELESLRESVALFQTGVFPTIIPNLNLNHQANKASTAPNLTPTPATTPTSPVAINSTNSAPTSPIPAIDVPIASSPVTMANLKNSFEEWRSLKEDPNASASRTDLSLDVFENSLYHVIGTLDQDIFQQQSKELEKEPNASPTSLSERLSVFLERVKAFSSGKMENAISSSVSSIFKVNQEERQSMPSSRTYEPPKSRFEVVTTVPDPATPNTALPNLPSVSSIFKDFAQPQVPSLPSISSLLTNDKEKSDRFFAQNSEALNSKPESTPITDYFRPTTAEPSKYQDNPSKPTESSKDEEKQPHSIDPDWYLKWTKQESATSVTSTKSSGIGKLETVLSQPSESSPISPGLKEKPNRKTTTAAASPNKSATANFGFESIE